MFYRDTGLRLGIVQPAPYSDEAVRVIDKWTVTDDDDNHRFVTTMVYLELYQRFTNNICITSSVPNPNFHARPSAEDRSDHDQVT